jgi:hypothetical protein
VTEVDPVFIEPIRRLSRRRQKLTYTQIAEAPELVRAAKRAKRDSGVAPALPTVRQVTPLVKRFRRTDPQAMLVEAGARRLPHSATSISGYVRSIPTPALVVQVDEHWLDVFVVTDEGAQLTERVHAAVLICAKTAAILGAVLSPRSLTEEDYMRLLKQCMEPKDAIAARAGAVGRWPCYGRPVTILSDRGRIFLSAHATDVVVDRFGIREAVAPPYAPSVKGVVEALFRWVTERFSHRLPGTTKSSPADRGQYDSQAEALKGGVTFTELESLFYRAIVDGYMADWDRLRGDVRLDIWDRDVERFGVPRFLGTADELKLLLLRAASNKHGGGLYRVQGGGVSFLGNWYVGEEGLTRRLRDAYVRVYHDRRDIGTVYLFDPEGGAYLGAAHCAAYLSRRVSVWEQEAERRSRKASEIGARAGSSAAMTGIVADAQSSARARRRAAKEAAKAGSRAAFLDGQQEEIHPEAVLAERRRLAREAAAGPAWLSDPSALPGPDDEPRTGRVIPFVRRRGSPP